MKMTARGSIAVLMTCMAAAGAASPAVADAVPVGVPLDAVETTLGVDTPRVATAVPVPTVGAPEAPRQHTGDMLPTPLLPVVPVSADLGRTLVTSPCRTCSARRRRTVRVPWKPRRPPCSPAPPARSSAPR